MTEATDRTFLSDVPARLDRLPWSRFHVLVVAALGVTWILDGLAVTLAGSVAGVLQESPRLRLTAEQVGIAATAYLAGAVIGALWFGRLTDRLGRKKLFTITLGVYLVGTALTGVSWSFETFVLFRFITGAGVGGEYSAINSAIHELMPARLRGRIDLAVNGSFWVGAAMGAGASAVLLDPDILPVDVGWRVAFVGGAALGLIVLLLRRHVPESPRWLLTHGRGEEARAAVADIEARVERATGRKLERCEASTTFGEPHAMNFTVLARTLLRLYPERTVLCLVLMASQAFVYNAIFFTYALVLTTFYAIPAGDVGLYILPFAAGNFLGPLLLGPLFDRIGRKPMIVATYALSGVLLAATGQLFVMGWLDAASQTAAWTVVFFFASAAASAGYLTIGESFPLEIRALTIALFYALGTLFGAGAPWLFGAMIQSGDRHEILVGYLIGAGLMLAAAAVASRLCVNAECRSLEEIAPPLCARGERP